MADSMSRCLAAFEAALNREFQRSPNLWDVDEELAEEAGTEAARTAMAAFIWKHTTGECFDTSEVTRLLGITRQALAKRVRNGKLLGLPGRGTTEFPRWQFDENEGDVREEIPVLIGIFHHYLGRVDPYVVAGWAAQEQPELEGLSPREWIEKEREQKPLFIAASRAGEELAR